ncbi:hypothetical protein [Aquabacter cavernae]|uniref:hypothetical protein n=1 Tax=Aquabacter cavernae TaxID=2496029 RepID=UPI000F8E1E9B|nr:hypothetical protein [Aquabacter cavernae]
MTFPGTLKTILVYGCLSLASLTPAVAQSGGGSGGSNETRHGAWTFFTRPDPQSKKTEYTIYNPAQKVENVALMFRCTPNGLWGFLFDGTQHKAGAALKVSFKFDGKTTQAVEAAAGDGDPVIMLRVTDALISDLIKARTFSITASGEGPAKTYSFDNAEAQAVFLLFSQNCQG